MRALITAGLLVLLVLTGTAILAVMRPSGGSTSAGSSESIRDARAIGPFKRVRSNGSINLVIDANASRPALAIAGRRSDVARVKTVVSGDTLVITQESGINLGGSSLTATIASPGLQGVVTEGAGDLAVSNINGPSFSLGLSGAGDAKLSGATQNLDITLSGTGDIDAAKLDAGSVTVALNGTGDVKVRARSSLAAQVNGTGNLTYFGHPAHVTKSVNGTGSISAG